MRRAVLDPGVLVSALIAPDGPPARLLEQARTAEIELIVSPLLLGELEEVLRRDKFRRYVDLDAVEDYLELLGRIATLASDPDESPPLRSVDPDDDYLITLAFHESAVLIPGDSDLLDLVGGAPITSPADFGVSALTP